MTTPQAAERLRRNKKANVCRRCRGSGEVQDQYTDGSFARSLSPCPDCDPNNAPIDAVWLRSVGAKKHEHPDKWTFYREDALPVGLWHVDDGWKAMLIHTESWASCIVRGLHTRGDLIRLASALGIELVEKGR